MKDLKLQKVLLVHPGKQHSFQTAKALKDAGILYKYITTVYDKKNSFTRLGKIFLNKKNLKKANSRHNDFLNDCDVVQFYELLGLFVIFLSKFPLLKPIYLKVNLMLSNLFAYRAAKYAIRNRVDAIIVYDGLSKKGLEYIKKNAPETITIMDVSISARPFMKECFKKDIKLFESGLYNEEKHLWKNKTIKVITNEFKYTDYFFAPSNVVVKSLEFCGIPENKIIKVPYGVNVNDFRFTPKIVKEDLPLRLIFVGQVLYRKGIHHLLNVVSRFSTNELTLKIAGTFNHHDPLIKKFHNMKNIDFLGFTTKDILAKEYQNSDIFILPSLGEGQAMVIFEALATGTPVICTELSGGNDAIINYYNGIVCESSNEDSLYDAIKWFIDNKNNIPKMSENARKTALDYTWDNYHKNYIKNLYSIISLRK